MSNCIILGLHYLLGLGITRPRRVLEKCVFFSVCGGDFFRAVLNKRKTGRQFSDLLTMTGRIMTARVQGIQPSK